MKKWVIAVDFFMCDAEGNEWTEKNYLYTTGKHRIYTFHDDLDAKDDLKMFNSKVEAEEYITNHELEKSCCYINCRPEKIDKPINLHKSRDGSGNGTDLSLH